MIKKRELLKKLACAGLTACMLFTMIGCGSGSSGSAPADTTAQKEETQAEKTDEAPAEEAASEAAPAEETSKEPITFDIAVNKHTHSMCEDFNEQLAFQMAEEATGVHINWIMVPAGSTEKVNAMLTADLPDAFLGLITESQIASSMDSFLDISGMLEQYCPHVLADYATIDGGLDLVTWSDGSVRALMTGVETSYQDESPANLFINKVWLDQLGLEMPTTMDELHDVLIAFRDNDMNGNGDTTDEIPLKTSEANWAAKIINLANSWGIAGYDSGVSSHYFMVKDGIATPTLDTPAFREYLEYMHMLVEEGLMDVESFTETNDQFFAKLKSGVCGVALCFSPYAMMPEEVASQYEPIVKLDVDGYDYVKTGHKNQLIANKSGFAITSACENPERLLEWWDYLSSDRKIKFTMRYGEEGGFWYEGDDGNIYQKTPEGLAEDFTVDNYKYTNGQMGNGTLILKDEVEIITKEDSYSIWFKTNTTEQVWDMMQDEYPPTRLVDSAKLEERTFMETDLFAYIQNFTATSILNGVDDASWDGFLAQLKTLQYYDWIQWYQDYIDGKF